MCVCVCVQKQSLHFIVDLQQTVHLVCDISFLCCSVGEFFSINMAACFDFLFSFFQFILLYFLFCFAPLPLTLRLAL